MSLYEESNQFRAELEQQVENVDIREITQLPNFKNWFNSKKAHSKCYDYDLPKLFYRTLNSIDNLDNIVNGNEQSRFVGEYFTDDLDTALTYVEHLENSKVLIGFLNIQNPAIIDCKGAGWNEIRQNATITEQLAYFEYLGFNEKPDNFEENRAYPIDLRNDEKDEGISFFLQIKTINKDTTPSFIKITAPQYYQNDRSFRKTKFINLDMLGYGTPSLFNDIGTTNFWATNLAHRHRFDSVIFENLNDDGGRGATLFEKSVKKRKMQGTVVCAFDRENSYFKHANNHGDFNPDDRRIFYSLFDIEQDFKQELKTEKDKTMQQTQTTADNGGFSYPQMAFEDKKSVLQAVKKEIQAVVDKMNTDLYDDYYEPQERQGDFIYDTSKSPYPIVIDGEVNLHYPLLLDENGNVQYEIIKPKPLTINRLFRYQVEVSTHRGDKTVWRGMRFNNADEFEYAVSQIQKQHDNYNAGRMFAKPDDPKNQKNPYWAIINDNQPYWQEIQAAFDKYVPVLQYITTAATGFIKDEQKQAEFDALSDEHKALVRQFSGNLEQEKQTMQQTQATQQTAAQGGFSYPKIDRATFVAIALFFQHELKKEIQAVVDKVNADSAEFYAEHQRAVKDENGNVLGYEPAYCTIDELVKYKWHEPDNNRVFWGVDFDNVDNFGFQVYRVEQRHDELNKDFHETPEIFGNIEKNPHWKIFDDNQPYWQEIKAAFDKYYPVLWNIKKIHNPVEIYTEEQRQAAFDALNDEQRALVRQFSGNLEQEKQTMQQTQATQETALQGGISSPKNPENTVNYDLTGLSEFSGSVSAYFNNPKRQELVLAFKQTLERSFDLRHQHFIGIHPKQSVQFERIAAFSPLELSAILDCKPEFANNLREYIAVVEDFERNHQQQEEAHKKAADALRISPAYQEMNDKRKNWARIDLYSEYIDGGEKFARAKTGEITNAERLKNAMHNAIETIAPAVKYSLNQEEFWQERDDKAFIKQSQIRDLLRSQMGFPAEMVEVKTRHQIWNDDRDMHDTISKSTAGFFTPKNGKTVVIADAFIENPELAVFTAYHELGHRGIELQGRELWDDWLQQARQNPTVRAIADHAQVHYADKGNILSDIAATEEALVEVFAAYQTQKWDYLAQRHNVEIPQEFKKPQGTAEKLWQSAKNKIGQIFGRQPETLPDSAVFAMLGKLEQSLYQFPEWKQKLEKTVRVGQHNPFVVAKQPIISGRPRVNPTALTNRYRSGGLRFDLNEQEQAMKSSQEILAEVMNKYETPIDNKDGLMNKPLYRLSAAELEDRRTVLSCRIDKVVQNRESRNKLHQLNVEYRNVENEMARRKTLSDNLNKVMRKSQFETLSVREFTLLSESFDELLRQSNNYDENSVIREVIRQELVAIRARMDGWKQPETLSIDDKLAMTEQKLRKINMDIEDRVYHYGADDKTVQNHFYRRTELLGDLETLKEQAATQGGISLDDKNSRHAKVFLLATKALLYRDLENAVRWYNHFIEESKEIPVPQSVIDMQTKRIEEYSKKLNEYLYGDERQKYRDMFPEQIEEIKQDFKKMLENLETSPENTVKQDAFGLPEKEKNMQDIEQRYNENAPKDAMPYDEFVASIDHDKERIEDAHNQFRSLYQGGYGASSHEGTGMFNSFEYTAENGVDSIQVAAPFEWAMENAQHILRDNYELLDGASLNLVHSNLTNDNFDGILDELQFRAKLFQETQQNVAHLFGIENSQVWDLVKIESNAVSPKYHLENNLLPMAEMTKQQAFEYVSVYQQWSKAVDLREVNQEKGLDTSTLDEHIAELRSSLDNKLQAARQQSPVLHDMNRLPEKQEQAMKSSQEILAEVIGKYKNHIDSQDGLMNRPLHWLSAAELEDRRTVLSYRIDKVIQNRESRDKLHQLNGEYRNVENEMARRKTLSDNLKEVLESQSETLSVRDFVVLTDGRDELRRQIWHTTGNFELEEKINQELAVIKAKIDSCWKRPETLSIDDELALTEKGLRQVNMYIEQGRYSANGVDDRYVQERIAERTKLLYKLKTLEEQAAEKGGVSSPENTVKQDAFGLPEKEKNMQDIEQRYYAKFPNATRSEKFAELAKEQGKTDEEIKNALTDIFDEHFRGEQWEDKFGKSFVLDIPTNLDWEDKEATFVPVIIPLEKVKSEMRFTLSDDLSGDLSRYLPDDKETGGLDNLEYAINAYEHYRQKTADFFGIEQSQVAEFLGYTEPKELLEQARQIVSGTTEQAVEVKQDAFSQPEKENTMNETEKQALARAFKLIEGFDADIHWQEVQMVKELQNRPESEIVAALAWDEVATAMQDFVEEQSESNTLKLRNAYMAYPLYNELANKGIPNDENLQRQYGIVIADKRYSSFDERRTAALFILQSVWNGRGNTTSITRSYNIDAMTAYIARTQPKYFDSWAVDRNVNERFLTKSSIFTHKNLREMGLDNNPNLAPYAPELLQEMVKIEEQYREFSQWQNQNSEGGWYNRGAENIIDFKQIPAAVQKDLILMITHTYSLKRGMFGVYDNSVIGMRHGLAARSEVQSNLEKLIEQQEKEWQKYQKMALGVSVPQENAIVEQINLYKQTLEQVKNAPAVAFVPEMLFVRGETKPDWRTGEVQRYNTTEINTATGEIAFVNDKNNPNPNPFGDMTEQARQYLSANNNFALAALSVAPRKMPENMKFDAFGQPMTENEIRDDWEKALRRFDDTRDIMNICHWAFAPEDIHQLAEIHENNPDLREKIEDMFSNANFRFESTYLKKGEYWVFDEKIYNMDKPTELLDSRIEKRDEVFNLLYNSGMANIHQNEGEVPYKDSLAVPFANTFAVFEEKTGNLYFTNGENKRLFEISTDKQNATAVATAFLIGVEAYKSKFDWANPPEISPKKLRDIQNTVNQSLAVYSRMFKLEHNLSNDSWDRKISHGFEWYAEPPKTPQVKFDMFEQGVSMPTKNVEKQPANLSLWLEKNGFDFEDINSFREVFQKGNLKLAVYNDDGDYTVSLSQFDKNIPVSEIDEKMIEPTRQERIYFFQNTDDLEKLSQYLREMEQGVTVSKTSENGVETQSETVYEFDNGCFVIISNNFADNIDKNGNGDFDNEAQLLHKDYPESLATYYYSVEGVDNSSAIHLFDNLGRKDYDNFRNYEVDLSNPNWQQDLAKEMVSFVVSKEIINGLDKQQPAEIVKISNGADFRREMSVQMETQRIEQQRIEKREQIFDILFAVSSSMSNVEHENADFRANNIWANYGNMSIMYGRFDVKTGDFKYRTYGGDDIFVINTDKISARTAATAFLRGVDEYREKFVYGKSTALTPKKRRDIQNTVDFSIAKNRRMEDISSYQDRRERLARIERQYAERETQKQTALQGGISSPENSVKFDDFGVVPENGNAMKIDTSLPFEEQYKQYQLAEEWISRQSTEASAAVQYLQGQKGFSGFNPERLEKAIAEESRLAKQLDDLRQANPEFALMARAKHLDPKDMTPELRSNLERVSEWVAEKSTVKHDLNTPETLTPQEQALADGKAMTAADEKVGDAKWELDKQPNNPERQAAYQQAIAEREELHNEIKQRVSAAMDKGEPYVIRYDEVPTTPFNGEKAPIELVVTQKGNLRLAIGTLDKPHNLTAVDSTPELALNTEQRSTPERTAEVLRERFNQPSAAIADKLACINYPAADKVFSEQEIKDALNKALKSPFKEHQLAAIHSPRMKDEWLKSVGEKHNNPEVVAAVQAVLGERQAKNYTADKGGFFSPSKEEEPATVADDDGYERD